MKLLALLSLLATPVAAGDTTHCFQLGQIAEKIAIARDAGYSLNNSIMAIPIDIPTDRYILFVGIVSAVYGNWRYEAPVDIGATIFEMCVMDEIR